MLAPVEIGKSKYWNRVSNQNQEKDKEYLYDDSRRIVEIERTPEEVTTLEVTEHEDFVREVLREIEHLFFVKGLSRYEVLDKIKETFGLSDGDGEGRIIGVCFCV